MLLRQYTRGKNGAIFLPYTLIFLTLQRWQTFFNCANFLQNFFDFFVKCRFGGFVGGNVGGISIGGGGGGWRFLLLRSCFDTSTAGRLDRLITGGKAYFVAFFGRSFARCGIVPRSGVYPLKRRVFGVFRGVALPVCYLYKKMIDCGGGWNREGLIFLYRFFKAQKRPFEGRFLRFKNFLYIFKILCFGNRL